MIRAARYLGVAPWELAGRPKVWIAWALDAEAAEIGAQNIIAKKGNPKVGIQETDKTGGYLGGE